MYFNLTPHNVVVYLDGEPVKEFPPSGMVARVVLRDVDMKYVDGVPILYQSIQIVGLPEPDGSCFITSSRIAKLVRRDDVVSPDTRTHAAIYNDRGDIIGVPRFQRFLPLDTSVL